jgi:hypothetical protein
VSLPLHFRTTALPGSFCRTAAIAREETALARRLSRHGDQCTKKNCELALMENVLVDELARIAFDNPVSAGK